jgi:hypothetical protein
VLCCAALFSLLPPPPPPLLLLLLCVCVCVYLQMYIGSTNGG